MNKKVTSLGLIGLLLVFASQTFACTTFVISGKNTADGKPILFKNRDTDQMQNSLAYFNDGRYKYIGLVDGIPEWKKMVWGGYNETGFAIINSAAYNQQFGRYHQIHRSGRGNHETGAANLQNLEGL